MNKDKVSKYCCWSIYALLFGLLSTILPFIIIPFVWVLGIAVTIVMSLFILYFGCWGFKFIKWSFIYHHKNKEAEFPVIDLVSYFGEILETLATIYEVLRVEIGIVRFVGVIIFFGSLVTVMCTGIGYFVITLCFGFFLFMLGDIY